MKKCIIELSLKDNNLVDSARKMFRKAVRTCGKGDERGEEDTIRKLRRTASIAKVKGQ